MNVYGKNSLSKLEKKGLDPTLKKFLLYAENKIENSTITFEGLSEDQSLRYLFQMQDNQPQQPLWSPLQAQSSVILIYHRTLPAIFDLGFPAWQTYSISLGN